MRSLRLALALLIALSWSVPAFSRDDSSDDSDNGGGKVLGGALMGGLLGGGLGAAIGSASGNAGKGALIGAGVGAVGGGLLGANQQSSRQRDESYQEPRRDESGAAYENQNVETQPVAPKGNAVPKDAKIKKKVIREFDDQGNVISEREVKE
jgi:uncharacterized protein YcfJ